MAIIAYALKTKEDLLPKTFAIYRDAKAYAIYLVSNQKDIKWNDVYTIVKVKITELQDSEIES